MDMMTVGMFFEIGSASKTFVATLLMQLVDEGAVDLDDPLAERGRVGGLVTAERRGSRDSK